jgi:hypothetical protein
MLINGVLSLLMEALVAAVVAVLALMLLKVAVKSNGDRCNGLEEERRPEKGGAEWVDPPVTQHVLLDSGIELV